MVAKGVEFPELVVNGIAENPYRLIGTRPPKGKDLLYVRPVEALDIPIAQNEPRVIPVDKVISEGIEIETPNSTGLNGSFVTPSRFGHDQRSRRNPRPSILDDCVQNLSSPFLPIKSLSDQR
jgi:hypothetical protein